MSEYTYPGRELELFRHAVNWKRYCAEMLQPFISGDVLDVGAGIGGGVHFVSRPSVTSWTALEPDSALLGQLRTSLEDESGAVRARTIQGTVGALPAHERYDTILYIDVLEHVEHDRAELAASAKRLRPGGHLIVLAPAHEWLRSPFDDAVGHLRRYTPDSLSRAAPGVLRLVRVFHLDSLGVLASAANRWFLRTRHPGLGQIRLWDRVLVPGSRVVDRLFGHAVGKTVVAVWQRPVEEGP